MAAGRGIGRTAHQTAVPCVPCSVNGANSTGEEGPPAGGCGYPAEAGLHIRARRIEPFECADVSRTSTPPRHTAPEETRPLLRLPLGGHARLQGQPVYRLPVFPRNPRVLCWLARTARRLPVCRRAHAAFRTVTRFQGWHAHEYTTRSSTAREAPLPCSPGTPAPGSVPDGRAPAGRASRGSRSCPRGRAPRRAARVQD